MSKSKQTEPDERDFFETVRESSTQIWLAGLGAFAKAQQEGGKAFEKLTKEGEAQQQKMREFAEGQLQGLQGLGDDFSNRMSEASSKAAHAWDRLESVFEERVSRAAQRIGLPTQGELQSLRQAVDKLSAEVAQLREAAKPQAAKTGAARPRAAKTPD